MPQIVIILKARGVWKARKWLTDASRSNGQSRLVIDTGDCSLVHHGLFWTRSTNQFTHQPRATAMSKQLATCKWKGNLFLKVHKNPSRDEFRGREMKEKYEVEYYRIGFGRIGDNRKKTDRQSRGRKPIYICCEYTHRRTACQYPEWNEWCKWFRIVQKISAVLKTSNSAQTKRLRNLPILTLLRWATLGETGNACSAYCGQRSQCYKSDFELGKSRLSKPVSLKQQTRARASTLTGWAWTSYDPCYT